MSCKPFVLSVCELNELGGGQGWSPVLAIVEDGERRVLNVADWIGGDGEKPETGHYIGLDGFVEDIEDAVDIRGSKGPRGMQGQSVMRCGGIIQDRALVASVYTFMTPIVQDGDSSMINGNTFVAPVDGLYTLSVGGGYGSASADSAGMIKKNNIAAVCTDQNVISISKLTGWPLPSNTITCWLNKGEYLSYFIWSGTTQTSINSSSATHKFEFALIG